MDASNLIGAPTQREAGGFFDPLNLAGGKSAETLNWYRAAELKHGRVAMLASLGVFFQALYQLPNPAFSETDPFAALKKVYYENPSALIQVGTPSFFQV